MIDVLLATYKAPQEYLKAQVDSILAQKGVEVNLLRREDEKGEGACANFAALLEESKAEYIAFADQDDVWDEDKLAREMRLMRELEEKYGKETPILVFSDARVTDEKLAKLDDSLFARSRIDPSRLKPRQLALQNVASGNTILLNAALRAKASPIPEGAFMHDHWVALVASVFGKIACLEESTLSYRQHGGNVIGGAKVGLQYFFRRTLEGRKRSRTRFYEAIRQIEAFVERFGGDSPRCFLELAGLGAKPYPSRVLTLLRNRVFKRGIVRNLSTLAYL